VTFNNSFKWKK